MNECERCAALLDAFVDGELSPEEMAAVQAHLDQCPVCRSYADDALAIRAAFPQAEETEVPEGFAEAVSAVIRAQTPVSRQKKSAPWRRTALPLAACCALVILLSQLPGGPLRTRKMESSGASSAADTAAPAAVEDSMDAEAAVEEPEASADEEERWKSLTEEFSPAAVQSSGAQLDTADAGTETGAPAAYSEPVNDQTNGTAAQRAPNAFPPPETSNQAPMEAETPATAPPAGEAPAQDGGRAAPSRESEPEAGPESKPAVTAVQGEEGWVEYGNVVFAAVVYLPEDSVGNALDGYEGRPYSNANHPEKGVIGTGYALEQEDFERILDEVGYSVGPMLNQDRTTELNCIVVTK